MMKCLRALAAVLPILTPLSLPAWAEGPSGTPQPPAQASQAASQGETARAARQQSERRSAEQPAPEGRRLPPDSVTQHSLDLGSRKLSFTATAGSLPLMDPQGKVVAEIGYVAYTLNGADPAKRPVTFAINGGPGAASAYLQLGVLGPWRVPLDGKSISPSAPPSLTPNAETWLDFTDLVFIDPVDTGYSRAAGSQDQIRDRYFTVDGDVSSLSAAIARWLRVKERMASPKFYVGESYGGFRGPIIAETLQTDQGIGFSGLVLLSPVLDFNAFNQPSYTPYDYVAHLPSMAAAALEVKGPLTRETLREAESYATGEYLTDLLRGVKDREAVERASRGVAALTGLDPDFVRRLQGRVDMRSFQREFDRKSGRIASAYDTGVTGYDPTPGAARARFEDPLLSAMTAPLTSAVVDLLSRKLNWKVQDLRYELLNNSVNSAWRWGQGRGQPEAVSNLRNILALDGNLRVLIAHGFTDLVTPYFLNEMILRQIPAYGSADRLSLAVYPGGHMFYSRSGSRAAFRADALKLYEAALAARDREGGEVPEKAERP